MLQPVLRNKTVFYVVLLSALYVAYAFLRPYLGVIIFSIVITLVFRPVYRRYLVWFRKRQGVAIVMTIVTMFVVILIPLTLIAQITITQAIAFSRDIAALNTREVSFLSYAIDQGNEWLGKIPFDHGLVLTEHEIIQTLRNTARPVGSFLANQALEVGTSTVDIIASIIIFLSLVSALLPGWPRLLQLLKDLSPLDDEMDQKYIERVVAMTHSMVRGIFVVAVAQGMAMGFFIWVTGVPYAAFWTLLSVFLSILPVGASLVAFPVGIVLLLTGNIWQGLVVLLGYILVVSNIDTLLRAQLSPREARVSPTLALLSLFSGVKLFGFMGVIYGPAIMIFLLTTIELYLENRDLLWGDRPSKERVALDT